jgi:hypothetical protein
VPEVRNAIDNYEETSPLYGFLQYRRRKVILRYMPEGLSRLVQGMYSVFRSIRSGFDCSPGVLHCHSSKQCSIPVRPRQIHPK